MSIDGGAVESSNRYSRDGHDSGGFRLVRKSLWGVEAYKLSAEFAHVVGSLPVPMYFLLQNTLSRIPGTTSVLMFCSVRGFCQFHTLLL